MQAPIYACPVQYNEKKLFSWTFPEEETVLSKKEAFR